MKMRLESTQKNIVEKLKLASREQLRKAAIIVVMFFQVIPLLNRTLEVRHPELRKLSMRRGSRKSVRVETA